MATRLYLPSTGAAPSTPTLDAAWDGQSSTFARYPSFLSHSGTSLAGFSHVYGTTSSVNIAMGMWVSPALDVNQTINGSLNGVLILGGCVEDTASADTHLVFQSRVVQGNTSTLRGTLRNLLATDVEFGTGTPETRLRSFVTNGTSINAIAGDRIVVEIGIRGVTPLTTSQGTMRWGDPTGVADFAATSGLTTDLCPYYEITDQTITFVGGGLAPSTQAVRSMHTYRQMRGR